MAEAAQINDPEKRAERELLIQEQYSELLNNLAAENEELKFNLQESTFSELFDLYNINQDNYESMTNNQQIMLDAFFNDETNLQGAAYNNLFNLYDENDEKIGNIFYIKSKKKEISLLEKWYQHGILESKKW